jgi:hypothetical protein
MLDECIIAEVEDRPVVKERVERYIEHHPVEKQVSCDE